MKAVTRLTPTCTLLWQRGEWLLALNADGNDAARVAPEDLDGLIAALMALAEESDE